jgi:predicted O-linked N-acetylglucosamine transferase (SPINDLY family)
VQVTFAGYPGSTGLDAIDYRLTDPHLDPPGNNDDAYCETSFRLPKTFWCFDPAANSLDSAPAVNSLPASHLGPVTFGCLNNFRKINEVTLKLWGKVLSGVPESRMILLTQEGSHRQWVCDILAKFGIASDRLIFEPMRSRADYLHLYHHIDIALDTLPYNGHSTSLDSFYMGVPVITMVGQTVVGRAGVSQLMNLGMPELIAHTEEDFVQIAASLAGNLKALAAMREGLRARMEGSPLMDAPAFARHIESAYRKMWQDWCAGQAVHPSSVASER